MFKSLTLENFTAFKATTFEWSPGVNVMIGANGTGKTHIMKLIYALQMQGHDAAELKKKLAAVFRKRPRYEAFRRLHDAVVSDVQ